MRGDGLPWRASKVIVLGDSCVGKTSLILQLSKAQFNPLVEPTIGTAYITSRIPTSHGECRLNIWDTAGQERFKSIIPMYMRGAAAVLLVCSVDFPASTLSLSTWRKMVIQTLPHVDRMYVAMNKIDLDPDRDTADVRAWAEAHGCKFFITSAMDAQSVWQMFVYIAEAIAAANQKSNGLMPTAQELVERPVTQPKCCQG
jgi:Ras-related protein Rab-5C